MALMSAASPLTAAPIALPAYAVEVKGLTKTYRGSKKSPPKDALKGIDLAIPLWQHFRAIRAERCGQIDADQHPCRSRP